MSILLQKSGILTTVQDLGRTKYRRFGINPNGAMDQTATRLINILLGNYENEAVLEMHFPAPQIVFEAHAIFAIGGGDLTPTLDGQPIENWRCVFAKKRSILKFAGKRSGNRSYLAVKGGFKVPEWLGSSSTNLAANIGGFKGRKLGSGDRIELKAKVKSKKPQIGFRVSNTLIPHYSPFPTVRVIAGAEFESLTNASQKLILGQDFTISNNSNRMGFRLAGEPIALAKSQELVSAAVNFGTIQLLPDGQLIVLMADQQTAGGYPRVAHVITHDLPLLAQLGANDKVAFHIVSIEDAEKLALEYEKELNFLRVGCKFQAIA
ncbi:MAG: biotin-dependent carboxyltransferase family protein [Acidobacteriota bacterium]